MMWILPFATLLISLIAAGRVKAIMESAGTRTGTNEWT